MKFKFKKDKYKNARSGYSRLLELRCRKCNNHIATYQKDGPGNLRRLYFDRIYAPEQLVNLQQKNIKEIPTLKCQCGALIGVPYIHEKENRKAFKLFQDALNKKIKRI